MTAPTPPPSPTTPPAAVPDPWPAPAAAGRVSGTVRLPGSKSLTNRLLVLAALAAGPSTLHGAPDSRDTRLMREALTALGAGFEHAPDGTLRVTPLPVGEPLGHEAGGEVRIDCGLAGTVMRFIPAVAALRPGRTLLDGDPGARRRPMGPLVAALRALGVEVTELGEPGRLPLRLDTPALSPDSPAEVAVDAEGSSQFLSALLLAAAARPGGLTVRHTGARVPSPEHVAMTVTVLRERGVRVDDSTPGVWHVRPGSLAGFTAAVEPDLSNAGPFLAAAAVTGGRVSVPDWPARTTQIGDRWRRILPAFGAAVELRMDREDRRRGTLTVTGGTHADGSPRVTGAGEVADTAELAPTVAALALLAEGPTALTGIGHLRGHETDRLTALAAEAERFGVRIEEGAERLDFPGTDASGPLSSAEARTYHDHRMATFAAVVGLRVPGTSVQDVATTAKTLPDFPALWADLVAPGAEAVA